MKKNFPPKKTSERKFSDRPGTKSYKKESSSDKKEVFVKTYPKGKSKNASKEETVRVLRPRINKSEKPTVSGWKGGFKKERSEEGDTRKFDRNANGPRTYSAGKKKEFSSGTDKRGAKEGPYKPKLEGKYGAKKSFDRTTAFSKGKPKDKFSRGTEEGAPKKRSLARGPENSEPRGKKGHFGSRDGKKFGNKTIKGAEKNYKGSERKKSKESGNLTNATELLKEEVRINRYISNSGICSRREADELIEQGLVTINGVVVKELGTKVMPRDEVKVDGRRITPERPVYLLMNKPKGFITTTADPEGRATVLDLIDLPGKERIFPIGRLDRNTTGILLLTNDGELAQVLTHPSFEIKKIYRAKLDKKPSKEHMLAWVNGVELEDGFMSFEQIGFVDEEDDSVLGLEIHSGRNRIVRRMFEHFQYEVKSLDRVMLGEFDKIKLGRGKWRFLNDKEISYVERLKRMAKLKGKKG